LTGPVAPGPYVAKVDATTGAQIWRTYLENANVENRWIGVANLNLLPSGNIIFAWTNKIALLDGDTGLILKVNTLPTGDAKVENVSFKHVTIAPDGTLILKDQSRPVGETGQGSMAMIRGLQKGLKMARSELVAVDPNTLKVLDAVPLAEAAGSPHVIATFEGKIAIYIPGSAHILRYFWDPATKKLSQDRSWVVSYLQPGQTTGTAPSVMGDWIVILTNGPGSKVIASSVVAVSQKDPAKMTTIFPFGQLKKGGFSFAPPKNGTDIENNMVYAADMGMGKVAGIKLDPATGAMKTVFVVDDTTTGFQPVIGPKDKRVLVLSNMHRDLPFEGTMFELMTRLYKEQVTWRDAATGRILAASDFFEPMQINGLITPGFGGRFYYYTDKGFIVLQVKPGE
jgi:outer membrane protein assembly factor BamB